LVLTRLAPYVIILTKRAVRPPAYIFLGVSFRVFPGFSTTYADSPRPLGYEKAGTVFKEQSGLFPAGQRRSLPRQECGSHVRSL